MEPSFAVVSLRRFAAAFVVGGLVAAVLFALMVRGLVLPLPTELFAPADIIVPVFRPDEPAPAFTLYAADGGETTEGTWAGDPYVLVFWALWCDACPDFLHAVAARHSEAKAARNVAIAAVNVADDPEAAFAAAARHGWPVPTRLDLDGSAALAFGVGYIPAVVIVDEYGFVRDRLFGPVSPDVYEARLDAALADR